MRSYKKLKYPRKTFARECFDYALIHYSFRTFNDNIRWEWFNLWIEVIFVFLIYAYYSTLRSFWHLVFDISIHYYFFDLPILGFVDSLIWSFQSITYFIYCWSLLLFFNQGRHPMILWFQRISVSNLLPNIFIYHEKLRMWMLLGPKLKWFNDIFLPEVSLLESWVLQKQLF